MHMTTLLSVSPTKGYDSRGGFRGGGGGQGAAAPPFVWVWDFLGQCPRMVHEPLRTFTIPDVETLTKTFHLHNFYLHFQRFEGPRFQNFPGGACPRTSLAYRCLHLCCKPPLQNTHHSPCVNHEISTFQVYVFDAAPNLQCTWMMNFPSKAWYLWSTHFTCYTPANCLKMQEMAVLEGLDFNNFRGSIPPDPPSLRLSVVISPPTSERALRDPCVNQEIQTFQA